MSDLPWTLHLALEKVGRALGIRLGRAHYYDTIIVPQAVEEWLERRADDPRVASIVAEYNNEKLTWRLQREERHRQRVADRRYRRLFGAPASERGLSYQHHDPVALFMELARAERRDDFIAIAKAFGINSPDRGPFRLSPEEFYEQTRQKLGDFPMLDATPRKESSQP